MCTISFCVCVSDIEIAEKISVKFWNLISRIKSRQINSILVRVGMQTVLILPTTVVQLILQIILRVMQYPPHTQRKHFKIPSVAMISANNAFTYILVYIIVRNGQTQVTMSLSMRAKHSFIIFFLGGGGGEAPYSSTE